MAYTFPDGVIETMNRQDIVRAYPTLPQEVHDMVGFMLAPEGGDRIPVVHTKMDSPELAVRALRVNIGRTLPTYDHAVFPDMTETGETREIERGDMFVIADGPTIVRTRPYQHFRTVLGRMPIAELAEELPITAAAMEPTWLHRVFTMVANAR